MTGANPEERFDFERRQRSVRLLVSLEILPARARMRSGRCAYAPLRNTSPPRSPVSAPSRRVTVPLTTTWRMPAAS